MSEQVANLGSIPGHLEKLVSGTSSYDFFIETGEVISDVSVSENQISFFMKNQHGNDNDVRFETDIQAMKGNTVSVLYACNAGEQQGYAVAWANHNTGKAEYFKETAREIVGNKTSMFFLNGAESVMDSTSNISSTGGGLLTLLMLPLLLIFLFISISFLVIGGLIGLKSESKVKAIMGQAESIMTSFDPSFAPFKKKRSVIGMFFKFVGLLFLLFIVLSILVAIFE